MKSTVTEAGPSVPTFLVMNIDHTPLRPSHRVVAIGHDPLRSFYSGHGGMKLVAVSLKAIGVTLPAVSACGRRSE